MNGTSSGYSAAQALRVGGRDAVRQALLHVRSRTLAQAQAWPVSALDLPYDPGLNPPCWEWGHVAWFQEYWIARNRERHRGAACNPAHQRRPSLLGQADAWYDSSRVAHRARWSLPIPGRDATLGYLAASLEQTLALLDAMPPDAGHDALYFFRLVALHEAMHTEATAYMAPRVGVSLPQAPAPDLPQGAPVIQVPAQRFRLGTAVPGFAFDNELGSHEVALPAFEIDAQPVSWPRFQDFVQQGGYAQARWWTDAGWAWRQQARPRPPAMPPGAGRPAAVHLSAHEAQAWCRWAGRRLPTEAEWECAALTVPEFSWGQVWEWTASAFEPYPGFTPHPYRDYSAPWFSTRTVLRGACAATSPWLAHPRYRNFFEPHRTDVFAGFRSCAA